MHLNVSWPSFSLGTLVALSLSNLFPINFSLNTQLPHNFSANNVKKLLSKGRGSQLSVVKE